VSAELPFSGRTFIADTSAWIKARKLGPTSDFAEALRAGLIATCAPVRLELFAGTRTPEELEVWDTRLDALHNYEINRAIVAAAVAAVRDLSQLDAHGLQARISATDALIAATAAQYGVGVLHDDGHFDRLARVLAFESERLRAPEPTA
jgi:predicted nucleic acid-binding protein